MNNSGSINSPGSTLRILLVEDSPTDARLIQHDLSQVEEQDLNVVWVENVGEAIERLHQEQFDVALLDLGLPDSMGLTTATRIQAECPRLPIIILTGANDEAAGIEAIHMGVQDYLVKGSIGGKSMARVIRYAIERKRNKEALSESEARYHSLFNGMTEGFALHEIVCEANGKPCNYRFLDINPAFERLTGLRREDVIGKLVSEVLPDHEPLWLTIFADVALSGQPTHFNNVAASFNRYFEVFTYCPKPGQFAAVFMDITDRKKKEEEVYKLNRTLKALHNSSQAMMRATRVEDYLLEVCRIVVEDCGHAMVWVGYALDDKAKTVRPVASAGFEAGYLETLKLTWDDTERGRGPTGTAIRTGKYSACRNMLSDPQFAPWREEAFKRGYASSIAFPLISDEKTFGALTIYSREPDPFTEDEITFIAQLADDLAYGITALRLRDSHARSEEALAQSEERYRSLVELSPEAIFVNRADSIEFVNPAALKLFGATASRQILGKSPFDLFHPDCHVVLRERIKMLRAGQMIPQIEEKIIRLDGAIRDVEVSAAPFTDFQGTAIQVILRDVTNRKQAEEQLRKTAEELARSNKELEHFAYVASHDLQEPLRTVRAYAQLLHKRYSGKMGSDADDFIGYLVDGASRMQTLILDLLAYSRVSSAAKVLTPTDSFSSLKHAIGALHETVKTTGAVVTNDESLPVVMANHGQLAQLFQNLIGNGIKFHRTGVQPRIHVGVEDKNIEWIFSIEDNGIGIDPEYYEKVFVIFERLHGPREYSGTGIGLAICKRIVEHHRGRIWLESSPGEGTTFFFALPKGSPPADQPAAS